MGIELDEACLDWTEAFEYDEPRTCDVPPLIAELITPQAFPSFAEIAERLLEHRCQHYCTTSHDGDARENKRAHGTELFLRYAILTQLKEKQAVFHPRCDPPQLRSASSPAATDSESIFADLCREDFELMSQITNRSAAFRLSQLQRTKWDGIKRLFDALAPLHDNLNDVFRDPHFPQTTLKCAKFAGLGHHQKWLATPAAELTSKDGVSDVIRKVELVAKFMVPSHVWILGRVPDPSFWGVRNLPVETVYKCFGPFGLEETGECSRAVLAKRELKLPESTCNEDIGFHAHTTLRSVCRSRSRLFRVFDDNLFFVSALLKIENAREVERMPKAAEVLAKVINLLRIARESLRQYFIDDAPWSIRYDKELQSLLKLCREAAPLEGTELIVDDPLKRMIKCVLGGTREIHEHFADSLMRGLVEDRWYREDKHLLDVVAPGEREPEANRLLKLEIECEAFDLQNKIGVAKSRLVEFVRKLRLDTPTPAEQTALYREFPMLVGYPLSPSLRDNREFKALVAAYEKEAKVGSPFRNFMPTGQTRDEKERRAQNEQWTRNIVANDAFCGKVLDTMSHSLVQLLEQLSKCSKSCVLAGGKDRCDGSDVTIPLPNLYQNAAVIAGGGIIVDLGFNDGLFAVQLSSNRGGRDSFSGIREVQDRQGGKTLSAAIGEILKPENFAVDGDGKSSPGSTVAGDSPVAGAAARRAVRMEGSVVIQTVIHSATVIATAQFVSEQPTSACHVSFRFFIDDEEISDENPVADIVAYNEDRAFRRIAQYVTGVSFTRGGGKAPMSDTADAVARAIEANNRLKDGIVFDVINDPSYMASSILRSDLSALSEAIRAKWRSVLKKGRDAEKGVGNDLFTLLDSPKKSLLLVAKFEVPAVKQLLKEIRLSLKYVAVDQQSCACALETLRKLSEQPTITFVMLRVAGRLEAAKVNELRSIKNSLRIVVVASPSTQQFWSGDDPEAVCSAEAVGEFTPTQTQKYASSGIFPKNFAAIRETQDQLNIRLRFAEMNSSWENPRDLIAKAFERSRYVIVCNFGDDTLVGDLTAYTQNSSTTTLIHNKSGLDLLNGITGALGDKQKNVLVITGDHAPDRLTPIFVNNQVEDAIILNRPRKVPVSTTQDKAAANVLKAMWILGAPLTTEGRDLLNEMCQTKDYFQSLWRVLLSRIDPASGEESVFAYVDFEDFVREEPLCEWLDHRQRLVLFLEAFYNIPSNVAETFAAFVSNVHSAPLWKTIVGHASTAESFPSYECFRVSGEITKDDTFASAVQRRLDFDWNTCCAEWPGGTPFTAAHIASTLSVYPFPVRFLCAMGPQALNTLRGTPISRTIKQVDDSEIEVPLQWAQRLCDRLLQATSLPWVPANCPQLAIIRWLLFVSGWRFDKGGDGNKSLEFCSNDFDDLNKAEIIMDVAALEAPVRHLVTQQIVRLDGDPCAFQRQPCIQDYFLRAPCVVANGTIEGIPRESVGALFELFKQNVKAGAPFFTTIIDSGLNSSSELRQNRYCKRGAPDYGQPTWIEKVRLLLECSPESVVAYASELKNREVFASLPLANGAWAVLLVKLVGEVRFSRELYREFVRWIKDPTQRAEILSRASAMSSALPGAIATCTIALTEDPDCRSIKIPGLDHVRVALANGYVSWRDSSASHGQYALRLFGGSETVDDLTKAYVEGFMQHSISDLATFTEAVSFLSHTLELADCARLLAVLEDEANFVGAARRRSRETLLAALWVLMPLDCSALTTENDCALRLMWAYLQEHHGEQGSPAEKFTKVIYNEKEAASFLALGMVGLDEFVPCAVLQELREKVRSHPLMREVTVVVTDQKNYSHTSTDGTPPVPAPNFWPDFFLSYYYRPIPKDSDMWHVLFGRKYTVTPTDAQIDVSRGASRDIVGRNLAFLMYPKSLYPNIGVHDIIFATLQVLQWFRCTGYFDTDDNAFGTRKLEGEDALDRSKVAEFMGARLADLVANTELVNGRTAYEHLKNCVVQSITCRDLWRDALNHKLLVNCPSASFLDTTVVRRSGIIEYFSTGSIEEINYTMQLLLSSVNCLPAAPNEARLMCASDILAAPTLMEALPDAVGKVAGGRLAHLWQSIGNRNKKEIIRSVLFPSFCLLYAPVTRAGDNRATFQDEAVRMVSSMAFAAAAGLQDHQEIATDLLDTIVLTIGFLRPTFPILRAVAKNFVEVQPSNAVRYECNYWTTRLGEASLDIELPTTTKEHNKPNCYLQPYLSHVITMPDEADPQYRCALPQAKAKNTGEDSADEADKDNDGKGLADPLLPFLPSHYSALGDRGPNPGDADGADRDDSGTSSVGALESAVIFVGSLLLLEMGKKANNKSDDRNLTGQPTLTGGRLRITEGQETALYRNRKNGHLTMRLQTRKEDAIVGGERELEAREIAFANPNEATMFCLNLKHPSTLIGCGFVLATNPLGGWRLLIGKTVEPGIENRRSALTILAFSTLLGLPTRCISEGSSRREPSLTAVLRWIACRAFEAITHHDLNAPLPSPQRMLVQLFTMDAETVDTAVGHVTSFVHTAREKALAFPVTPERLSLLFVEKSIGAVNEDYRENLSRPAVQHELAVLLSDSLGDISAEKEFQILRSYLSTAGDTSAVSRQLGEIFASAFDRNEEELYAELCREETACDNYSRNLLSGVFPGKYPPINFSEVKRLDSLLDREGTLAVGGGIHVSDNTMVVTILSSDRKDSNLGFFLLERPENFDPRRGKVIALLMHKNVLSKRKRIGTATAAVNPTVGATTDVAKENDPPNEKEQGAPKEENETQEEGDENEEGDETEEGNEEEDEHEETEDENEEGDATEEGNEEGANEANTEGNDAAPLVGTITCAVKAQEKDDNAAAIKEWVFFVMLSPLHVLWKQYFLQHLHSDSVVSWKPLNTLLASVGRDGPREFEQSELLIAQCLAERCEDSIIRGLASSFPPFPPHCVRKNRTYGVICVDSPSQEGAPTLDNKPIRLPQVEEWGKEGLAVCEIDLIDNGVTDEQAYRKIIALFEGFVTHVVVYGKETIDDAMLKWCCEYTFRFPWRYIILVGCDTTRNLPENRDRVTSYLTRRRECQTTLVLHDNTSYSSLAISLSVLDTSKKIVKSDRTADWTPKVRALLDLVGKSTTRVDPTASGNLAIQLVTPPGAGKSRLMLSLESEGTDRGVHFVKFDCSDDRLVEEALTQLLDNKMVGVDQSKCAVILIADEFHMLTSQKKKEFVRWMISRIHSMRVVMIANRTDHGDENMKSTIAKYSRAKLETIEGRVSVSKIREVIVGTHETKTAEEQEAMIARFSFFVITLRGMLSDDAVSLRLEPKFPSEKSIPVDNPDFVALLTDKLIIYGEYMIESILNNYEQLSGRLDDIRKSYTSADVPKGELRKLYDECIREGSAIRLIVLTAMLVPACHYKPLAKLPPGRTTLRCDESMCYRELVLHIKKLGAVHPAIRLTAWIEYTLRYCGFNKCADDQIDRILAKMQTLVLVDMPDFPIIKGESPVYQCDLTSSEALFDKMSDYSNLEDIKSIIARGSAVNWKDIAEAWRAAPVTDGKALASILNQPRANKSAIFDALTPDNTVTLIKRDDSLLPFILGTEKSVSCYPLTRIDKEAKAQVSPYFYCVWLKVLEQHSAAAMLDVIRLYIPPRQALKGDNFAAVKARYLQLFLAWVSEHGGVASSIIVPRDSAGNDLKPDSQEFQITFRSKIAYVVQAVVRASIDVFGADSTSPMFSKHATLWRGKFLARAAEIFVVYGNSPAIPLIPPSIAARIVEHERVRDRWPRGLRLLHRIYHRVPDKDAPLSYTDAMFLLNDMKLFHNAADFCLDLRGGKMAEVTETSSNRSSRDESEDYLEAPGPLGPDDDIVLGDEEEQMEKVEDVEEETEKENEEKHEEEEDEQNEDTEETTSDGETQEEDNGEGATNTAGEVATGPSSTIFNLFPPGIQSKLVGALLQVDPPGILTQTQQELLLGLKVEVNYCDVSSDTKLSLHMKRNLKQRLPDPEKPIALQGEIGAKLREIRRSLLV